MESKDAWGIISWHLVDVFYESLMLKIVWDMVVELSDCVVEAVVLGQAVLVDPSLTIGSKELSIEIVGDSSTVLYLSDHVTNGLPRESSVGLLALSQMSIDIEKGCVHVCIVELVWDAET
jgi:hypothetical protein